MSLVAPTAPAAPAPVRPAPLARRLEVPAYDPAAARRLVQDLGISHVLAQVLVRRGFGEVDAAHALLGPSERHDPGRFDGMRAAVDTIERHLRAGSRIVVHGDYDVDGVCATAVLLRALRSRGGNVGYFLPDRRDDGYGLGETTVGRLAAGGARLIVTVDCGITAVEPVAAAQREGVEVIVTDHHAPRADGRLPGCPTVHPAVGGYPCADLCGTAVAHKLAEALGAETAAEDLELVALATVADLVPLTGENRRIVREGLEQMAGTRRPGLRALMAVSRADPSALDAGVLGFRLAPRINAAGRLRRPDAALELLLTDDPERAREIAAELDAVNAARREVERRIVWEAEAQAEAMGERSAYVLAAPGWHAGVVGIVASRIVERFHRPAVLIALDADDPLAPARGSGRSIPGFDLLGALTAAAGDLLTYGGHRAAVGLTILPERLEGFRAAVERHAETVLTPELLIPVERIDAVTSGSALTLELAEELRRLEPCGIGNPAVNLLVPGARFEGVRSMGEGRHARFNVLSGGVSASAVAFGCDGRLGVEEGVPVDASFRLERNTWNGVVEPRLVLRHARPARPEPITVLRNPRPYLELAAAELRRELRGGGAVTRSAEREDGGADPTASRQLVDRRGESPLAVITDARATVAARSEGVLVVCGDADRRAGALAPRIGGFALISHADLADDPAMALPYEQIIVLDPPLNGLQAAAIRAGRGYTQLAWGEPELRFSQQMHEQEFGLRSSLVALYRALRDRGRVAGEELEHLLRGDAPHRSARLAGRLLRVLEELELVSLQADPLALAIAAAQPTRLERSAAFRAYTQAYEDGLRFLKRATAPLTP